MATTSASAQTEEPRTPGYWKNHSDALNRHYDVTWDQVGTDKEFMGTGQSWLTVLETPPNGNAYYILAHQYIAAHLNVLAGTLGTIEADSLTDAAGIELLVEHARSLLGANPPDSEWFDSTDSSVGLDLVRAAMRQDFIDTALVLDEFNNSGEDD